MKRLSVLAGAIGLVAFTAGSCSTTSQYYRPNTPEFYSYGNFCGPYTPAFLPTLDKEKDRDERLSRLRSLPPLDHVDAACKAHDICYEMKGHDYTPCDAMMFSYLARPRGYLRKLPDGSTAFLSEQIFDSSDNYVGAYDYKGKIGVRLKCWNLIMELSTALSFKKGSGNSVMDQPFMSAFLLSGAVFNGNVGGFPKKPGTCFVEENVEQLAARNAAFTLIFHDQWNNAGIDAVTSCSNRYAGVELLHCVLQGSESIPNAHKSAAGILDQTTAQLFPEVLAPSANELLRDGDRQSMTHSYNRKL